MLSCEGRIQPHYNLETFSVHKRLIKCTQNHKRIGRFPLCIRRIHSRTYFPEENGIFNGLAQRKCMIECLCNVRAWPLELHVQM